MNSQQHGDQPSSESEHQPLSQFPPKPTVEETEVSKDAHNESKGDKNTAGELAREFRTFEKLSLLVNVVLALIGIGALWIYNGQLKVMQGQLNQMKGGSTQTDNLITETRNLAAAAKTQAEATKSQAESTKSMADRALIQANASTELARSTKAQSEIANKSLAVAADADRPWIGINGPPSYDPAVIDGKTSKVRINAVNSGRRPAHISRFLGVSVAFNSFPVAPLYNLASEKSAPGGPSQSVLIPGQVTYLEFTSPPQPEPVITSIKSGVVVFFIYGIVEYEDLETSQRHLTKYCFFFGVDQNTFRNCSTHNDAN